MRTYNQKWQRPRAGERQGLKSRFKTNSSRDTAREMAEGKRTRGGADRTDKSEGSGDRDVERVEGLPLHTDA